MPVFVKRRPRFPNLGQARVFTKVSFSGHRREEEQQHGGFVTRTTVSKTINMAVRVLKSLRLSSSPERCWNLLKDKLWSSKQNTIGNNNISEYLRMPSYSVSLTKETLCL